MRGIDLLINQYNPIFNENLIFSGLKQNSSLDNSCLLNSGDGVSHWNQGHWLKEKNPSVDTVMVS